MPDDQTFHGMADLMSEERLAKIKTYRQRQPMAELERKWNKAKGRYTNKYWTAEWLDLAQAKANEMSKQLRFRALAKVWRRETGHVSFVSQRIQHPAYKKILSMGESVVPYILEEMEQRPDHWFHALAFLTGENPNEWPSR